MPRTWSVPSPDQVDVPWEGRDRASIADSAPEVETWVEDDTLLLRHRDVRVRMASDPFRLTYERLVGGEWVVVLADLATGAYHVGSDALVLEGLTAPEGTDVAHAVQRRPGERVLGLGEKAGPLDRAGRRYEMRALDAMGYDAERTDPLYKHWPMLIRTVPGQPGGAVGLFYDNYSRCTFDLGQAKDNYHAPFWQWHADSGDLDLYLMFGDEVLDVTRAFVALTGRTYLPPRWSLGNSGSTMTYTDAPDASTRLLEFLALTKQHRIPCDSFQLSSGYTSIGDKRYVFTWNRDKFPEPSASVEAFRAAGVRLAANIKPCLLRDHPLYEQVAAAGLFVTDVTTGRPELSRFWDDSGSHLDFTNPDTITWWRRQIRTQLLDFGIETTWNDNNEFQVWDENALCHGFGEPVRIGDVRPAQTLLMVRASHEEQRAHRPERRPYVISRSGLPGMQRYAQTWSGDNDSSWETLRANTIMGVGMSLSGLYDFGHDVGGFTGTKPSPELFVRWVQNGIAHPRFTIHSWHEDGSVNEPWMYPEVLEEVRAAIELRYRLMPYLYTQRVLATICHEPIVRPTFSVDESDPRLWEENADFMLGPSLLVASVVVDGARTRTVRLPRTPGGWWDWHTGEHYAGGLDVELDAPLERLPMLVRGGAGIPFGPVVPHLDPALDISRELRLFPPPPGTTSRGSWYEDSGDGVLDGGWIRWTMQAEEDAVRVVVDADDGVSTLWPQLALRLPEGDSREIHVAGSVAIARL
ncbi:alpha-glucosidase [Mobilicoccus caccae]|uniref:Alpha-glucosidase n=1 Tax=Mobilicoccus caccae TaxID=1859295 RepID=A0ABQ6IL55_9MICO|nr:TIM-barrel domain-containing protein [Mobilicoccus caccae]GMA38630.1 alpha-glucosidase [Mobilicoccus caccae]